MLGVDPSDGFVRHAAEAITDRRARFEVGTGDGLPCGDRSIDVVTSGLAYNFIPDRAAALEEFERVARPDATISFYVLGYPNGGVGLIDALWKAAIELDPAAAALDESTRFPFCTPDALAEQVTAIGDSGVIVEAIEVPTPFVDFVAFRHPFTLGAGSAPGYLGSQPGEAQQASRQRFNDQFGDTQIDLTQRARAVKGRA